MLLVIVAILAFLAIVFLDMLLENNFQVGIFENTEY